MKSGGPSLVSDNAAAPVWPGSDFGFEYATLASRPASY